MNSGLLERVADLEKQVEVITRQMRELHLMLVTSGAPAMQQRKLEDESAEEKED